MYSALAFSNAARACASASVIALEAKDSNYTRMREGEKRVRGGVGGGGKASTLGHTKGGSKTYAYAL